MRIRLAGRSTRCLAAAAIVDGGDRSARGDAALTVIASAPDRLALVERGAQHPLILAGGGIFWTDVPRFRYSGIRFIRDAQTHSVHELDAAGQWYAAPAYQGPKSFAHPRAWDRYVGLYRTGGSLGSRQYDGNVRVQLIKGKLVLDDGTPLVALANGSFRMGADTWSPERLRFDTVVNGRAQRANQSGMIFGRVPMP